MVMLVVVTDEDGDAMLVMVGMDGHLDIVGVALSNGGGLWVGLEAGSCTTGEERIP